MKLDNDYYDEAWCQWDDMKEYGPVSRHVRRLVLKLLKYIEFASVLDVGCGVGILLNAIHDRYPSARLGGTEYSEKALARTHARLSLIETHKLNLSTEALQETYDLVTCVDVLEHIEDDSTAMMNLRAMTKNYLLVVIPLGPLFEVERLRVGHLHGYSRKEVDRKLRRAGFEIVRTIQWGFPLYNLYRRLLHRLPEAATTGKYGAGKRLSSLLLYCLLFINLPFGGERYFALCKPRQKKNLK